MYQMPHAIRKTERIHRMNHAYPVSTGSSDFAGFDDERKTFQQVKNAEI